MTLFNLASQDVARLILRQAQDRRATLLRLPRAFAALALALATSACAASTPAPALAVLDLPPPTVLSSYRDMTFVNRGPEAAILVPPLGTRLQGVRSVAAGQSVRVEWRAGLYRSVLVK
jgi:hypothetical protein